MKRATDKIADAIKAGKPPRRNGKSRCIGPAEALGLLGEDAVVSDAMRERVAGIAERIRDANRV
jgi:hypothetical protein